MDKLTADLQGVIVYLDDILVRGVSASDHLQNLRALFSRLQEKGLRCHLEKYSFAQPSVEYLGFMISNQGIAKGYKVDAIVRMPPPTDVTSLLSVVSPILTYLSSLCAFKTRRREWATNGVRLTIQISISLLHGGMVCSYLDSILNNTAVMNASLRAVTAVTVQSSYWTYILPSTVQGLIPLYVHLDPNSV